MSTPHVVDDELVEALVRFTYGYDPQDPDDARELERQRRECSEFIALHRLVRLPEEADGWQSEIRHEVHGVGWLHEPDEECARRTATDISGSTGRIRPVYRIPGQPIEVSKEGGEG